MFIKSRIVGVFVILLYNVNIKLTDRGMNEYWRKNQATSKNKRTNTTRIC
ncbi:hypothetical protein LAA29_10012 [Leuconostoc carnosum]|nr:hypothetical protein LAA29_10012 [Leuconostoc carnosum]